METHYCNKSLELGDQVGYLIAEGTVLGTLFLVFYIMAGVGIVDSS